MALGVVRAVREAGLQVPHDVSVVGFDDDGQPRPSHEYLFRPELVLRSTTGRVPD